MSLTHLADLEEDNERLRDQLRELEIENGELKAEVNELKAQLYAKEETATARMRHTRRRTVTVTTPEWEQLDETGAEW